MRSGSAGPDQVRGWLEAIADRLPPMPARMPAGTPAETTPAGNIRQRAPVMIGIDGPSGSGKSTLAGQLRRFLAERIAVPAAEIRLVRMDHLYPGWDGLDDGAATLARTVLPPLARGEPGSYPRWDWQHHRYSGRMIVVRPAPYVIVEGVGSCSQACAPFLTVQIWADAQEPVRFARAMARDGDTYRPHWQRWAQAEGRHFAVQQTSQRADLRFDTT